MTEPTRKRRARAEPEPTEWTHVTEVEYVPPSVLCVHATHRFEDWHEGETREVPRTNRVLGLIGAGFLVDDGPR